MDISKKIADVGREFEREKNYWLNKLAGFPGKSSFPCSPAGGEPEVTVETFDVEGPLFQRLNTVSGGSDPTLHIILTAAVQVLLTKYSSNRDVVVGTPVYRQEREEAFVNTVLPLRCVFTPGMTFKDVLMQVKETVLEALEHQDYPVERLVEDLKISPPGNDFPIFDVSVILENIQDKRYIQHIPHSMRFCFSNTPGKIQGRLEYDAHRCDARMVGQVIRHFINLLESVSADFDCPLSRVDILSEQERDQYLHQYNDTRAPLPPEQSVHRLFERQVEQTPGCMAVVDMGGRTVTYLELNQMANRLAHRLVEKGVRPGVIVGVMAERSIELIAALLAVLKTGAAYVPISPRLPAARKSFMIADSGLEFLITTSALANNNPEIQTTLQPQNIFHIDDPASFSENLSNPFNPVNPANPENPGSETGYIIYTSGTTGQPKGVVLTHRGIVNYLTWAAQTYVNGEIVSFPFYTDISFDLTVTSVYVPLITGNTVYIYTGADGDPLVETILRDNKVDIIKLTPSHFKLIPQAVTGRVKRFILGGENLDTATARAIHEGWNGEVEIYNEYGPTETVVGSMIHRYDPETDRGESVPIGVPIANTAIYLLDPDGNPVPAGVPGEIFIGGYGVAKEYLNHPELTGEKFIFNSKFKIQNSKLYKTGDLAVRQLGGAVLFLGRVDDQVKIHGHRVELGEIEFRLKEYKKQGHSQSVLDEKPIDMDKLKKVVRCSRCLLSANHPGIRFDTEGVCDVCREYDGYKEHVENYFQTSGQLDELLKSYRGKGSQYDCLLLFSGGKDSTYVLYRLIEIGLRVLTFTFDNGYISDAAFENIRRTTGALKVDHIVGRAEHMNRVFVESLESNHNVCHGCWHALNTYGAQVAREKGIHLVVSGLSRGQIFDMRLHPLYRTGVFQPAEIEEKLLLFRQGFHAEDNRFSRLLGESLSETDVRETQFLDYFRYDDTKVESIKTYLKEKGWVQPADTGFCSSNCRINDVGIYMYIRERGSHFYEAPLSWDVRMRQMTREQGLEELLSFQPEPPQVDRVLTEIGYYRSGGIGDAVVFDKTDTSGNTRLCGYIVSGTPLTASELRRHLALHLPDYMIPAYFVQVDAIPLAASGKVDKKALLAMENTGRRLGAGAAYVPPSEEREIAVAGIFKEMLKLERVGINDNFFELGATSFEIVQAVNQLRGVLGVEVPVLKLFEHPTIQSLLEYLNQNSGPGGPGEEKLQNQEKIDRTIERGKARQAQRRKRRN